MGDRIEADQERLCREVAAGPEATSVSVACRWLLAALDAERAAKEMAIAEAAAFRAALDELDDHHCGGYWSDLLERLRALEDVREDLRMVVRLAEKACQSLHPGVPAIEFQQSMQALKRASERIDK